MYGFNVFDLKTFPCYPIVCKDFESAMAIISKDPDRYVMFPRVSPEDDDPLEMKVKPDNPFSCQ